MHIGPLIAILLCIAFADVFAVLMGWHPPSEIDLTFIIVVLAVAVAFAFLAQSSAVVETASPIG